MNKECCTIKVNETEKGYMIEVTGDKVKECCKSIVIDNQECCSDTKPNKSLKESD